MELKTKYHGIRQYKEKDVIDFHKGLPGFEDFKRFILFPVEDNEMFSVLHSVDDVEVGFVVISPFDVLKDYEIKLDDETIKKMKIEKPEDVLVVNTVTLSSKVEDITTNLRAPIIINIKDKIGEQLILSNESYLVKYPLFKGDR